MTYRVYIKKDYKAIVRHAPETPFYLNTWVYWVMGISLGIAAGLMSWTHWQELLAPDMIAKNNHSISIPATKTEVTAPYEIPSQNYISPIPESSILSTDEENIVEIINENEALITPKVTINVRHGDNLSLIFDRLHISPQQLFRVISLGNETETLKHLLPGQELRFQITDGILNKLEYEVDLTTTLHVTRIDDQFFAENIVTQLETRIKEVTGVIDSSLFIAAQTSGISDNLIMQLIALYGWDIDFALDIRKGDRFYVIYEENYKDGLKVKDGPILAAEFVNQEKPYRAVRYIHADGHSDYYSETGRSMRKAFLRTPVNFTRISSRFSTNRKHPVLNKIRAHKGVDYAAPPGTVVKAAGDGFVTYAGKKGGYGNVIVLSHGGKYSTLYAHMSRFSHGIKKGKRIKQGQTIGYVGATGLATGPHLHYEFRINGTHHNPLTVKLPKALKISDDVMPDFKQQTASLLSQLNQFTTKDNTSILALNNDN